MTPKQIQKEIDGLYAAMEYANDIQPLIVEINELRKQLSEAQS